MWLHSSNSKFFESTVQSRSVLSSSCRYWGCLIERIPCNLSVDQCPVGGTPAQMTTLWGCGCLAYPHISSTFAVRPGDHSTTRFHLSWLSIGGMIFGVCAQLAEVLVSVNRAGKQTCLCGASVPFERLGVLRTLPNRCSSLEVTFLDAT